MSKNKLSESVKRMRGKELERLLEYWKDKLAGLEGFELPADRLRPAEQIFEGLTYRTTLDKELTQKLKELARSEGATLNMLMLAVFKVLLYRYTQQEDIALGVPIANRNRAELENLIGFFLNTLVIRTDLSGEPTFLELLEQVKETSLEAYEHQDLPFEKLVEALNPKRDLSRSPLFQVAFVMGDTSLGEEQMGDVQLQPIQIETGTSKFDLMMFVGEGGEQLEVALEYSTDLFDGDRIERMAGHYRQLLEDVVECPEKKVWELELLTEAEKHQILVEWNDTEADYPKDKCVHQLFEEQAEKTPDAVAVVYKGEQLTYRELNEKANQLGHYLQKLGVGPETLVAICVERSLEMVIGLLGILKAGGAYVPLDPGYPKERLRYMLEDTQTPVLLTQSELNLELVREGMRKIHLDGDWGEIGKESRENVKSGVKPENPVYVIYTSGSTGKPKGVLINHKNLVHSTHARSIYYQEKIERFLLLSSFAFDSSIAGIFGTLCQGGELHYISQGDERNINKISLVIDKYQISDILLVPGFYKSLLSVTQKERLSSLRNVIVAGEECPIELVHRHYKLLPNTKMFNEYGPTETTVWSTAYLADSQNAYINRTPIGIPIPNVRVYILDKFYQNQPIGIPGEIFISGEGVGRGYLNRPELTSERFVPDPFTETVDVNMYRTGDLACWLPNGNIVFLGRKDNQVKIRGYRIELREIEALLSQYHCVQSGVVIVREDVPGHKYLVAYVVLRKGHICKASELRFYLRKKLPYYMSPTDVVFLDNLPLTPNGKVDRKALPRPKNNSERFIEANALAITETERTLENIWCELFNLTRIGTDVSFFSLGGDSLLAMQVVARVQEALRVELSINVLFQEDTIDGLANFIDSLHDKQESLIPTFAQIPKDTKCFPLSFFQEQLWTLHQTRQISSAYNMPLVVAINGSLDIEILQKSINIIIQKHEILRACISNIDGLPFHTIEPIESVELPIIDLSEFTAVKRWDKARRWVLENSQQQFNLFKAPLFRVACIKLGEKEHLFFMNVHHIISDDWSTQVFFRELSLFYDRLYNNRDSKIEKLPVQYRDYVAWQRERLRGEVMESLVAYWMRKLEGMEELEMPTDRPRPAKQTFEGLTHRTTLDEGLTRKLKNLARSEGVTMNMLMLAVFKVLLHRYTQQDGVAIGIPATIRKRVELENLIGLFINTLVIRTDLSGKPTFRELLERVKETLLEAYEHQALPFEKLVEALNPPRDLSRSPLFQIAFVMEDMSLGVDRMGDATIQPVRWETGTSKYDLTMYVGEEGKKLEVSLEYNTDLFDDDRIERMAGHYRRLLEDIVEHPEKKIWELELLTEEERHQILVDWNDTAADYPEDKCAHQLFEEQVERTPDAVAVVYEEKQLIYRELNERANQLGHYLQRLGVGPESLVAICVKRSLEMIVGLLGILKAGGAYVPLDPSYPEERLKFMLEDTQAPVLLTQSRLDLVLPRDGAQIIYLDEDWGEIGKESRENVKSGVKPENPVYVIYTSGSTGKPKGVLINHKGLGNLAKDQVFSLKLRPDSRVLQFASLGFDASVFEIFSTLFIGATLYLGKRETLINVETLHWTLHDKGITTITLPPAVLAILPNKDLSDLETIVSAGEACSVELVKKWASGRLFINAYGPTETTVCATLAPCAVDGNKPPIGRPIQNTQVYILDRNLMPLPVGVPGELHVGGVGLARGYLNRPGLTTERFIPNPYSDNPGSRLYKTGDLARYLPDGNVEFLGRVDNQVKIRGIRIEPGEIESLLRQHINVQEAAIITQEDSRGNKHLVAYFVPVSEEKCKKSELRAFLARTLPDYMIPLTYIFLKEMPIAHSGKIDYQALQKVAYNTSGHTKGQVAPRTQVEKQLVRIWKEILDVEEIGITDNFFSLGGNSLSSVQIASKAKSKGLYFTLGAFFEHQTIRELAKIAEVGAGLPRQTSNTTTESPLLPMQSWYFEYCEATSNDPNISFLSIIPLKANFSINPNILEEALIRLVDHHEALRIVFSKEKSTWKQLFSNEKSTVSFEYLNLAGKSSSDQTSITNQMVVKLQHKFDLINGPLLQLLLIHYGNGEPDRVLILVHHLIFDAISLQVIIEDIEAIYQGILSNNMIEIPIEVTSYNDFCEQINRYAFSSAMQHEIEFWTKHNQDLNITKIPLDNPNGENKVESVQYSSFRPLNAYESKKLRLNPPKQYGVRVDAILLTALVFAFEEWIGRKTLYVNLIGHSRREFIPGIDVSRTVGFFTTQFPINISIDHGKDIREIIQIVNKKINSYTQHSIGYGALRYIRKAMDFNSEAPPDPVITYHYLGQADIDHFLPSMFTYDPDLSSRIPRVRSKGYRDRVLTISDSFENGIFISNWKYSKNLLSAQTIRRLSQSYFKYLRTIVSG